MSHPVPSREYDEGEIRGTESGHHHKSPHSKALHKFSSHHIKGPKKFPKLKMPGMFKKKAEHLKKLLKDK